MSRHPLVLGTRDVLAAAGLRPIIDEQLCSVLSDCPCCDAGAADPAGIYRPLVVGCFTREPGGPVRLCCGSGCDPAAIRAALHAPRIDWEAVALAYRAIAGDALRQLDAALDGERERTQLAVAA